MGGYYILVVTLFLQKLILFKLQILLLVQHYIYISIFI